MADKLKILLDSYRENRPLYEAFTKSILSTISLLLQHEYVEVFSYEDRTKEIESFEGKIHRPEKSEKYETLSDLTDLSGVRIITYLAEDCDKVIDVIRKEFLIDEANSVRKGHDIDPDRFGYQSTHLIVSYPLERLKLGEFKRYENLKAEIQIKTLLQHTWASIDWKLRYKNKLDAPQSLRRRLYRISALLDAADDEFSYVSNLSAEIRQNYENKFSKGDLGVLVDFDSISTFIKSPEGISMLEPIVKIFDNSNVSIFPDKESSISNLVKATKIANINSISELDLFIKSNYDVANRKIKASFDKWIKTPVNTSVSTLLIISISLSLQKETAVKILDFSNLNQTLYPIIINELD